MKLGHAEMYECRVCIRVIFIITRPGYEDDGAVLKEAFSHLGFDARHYLDLTVQNMICVLQLCK